MALPNIFTQTPIEAAIWTAAVGTQTEIARIITSTPIFYGCISLAIGAAALMFFFRLGTAHHKGHAVSKLALFLLTVCLGISFLSYQNRTSFSPVNARGVEWKQNPRVASNLRYSDLRIQATGLYWYTVIHRGLIEVSDLLTSAVGYVAQDPLNKSAPQYLVNALAATAKMSLDDPAVEETFDELVARCSDTHQGRILSSESSLKTLFNVNDAWCNSKYQTLASQLKSWARNHRPRELNFGSGASSLLASVGLARQDAVDNKIIASAVKNYARDKAGESYAFHNTNGAALVDGSDFWVNLTKSFSPSSAILSVVNAGRSFFGMEPKDLEGAAARNEAAVAYNQLLAFLPAARGYAKAIIAYLFIAAALGLCVGISGYFWGWLKMAAIFTFYEPISAAFYYFTTKMITTTETIRAMDSIRVDPLVLSGANIIDSNLARMELVYFCIQMGLLLTVAVAGIRAFGAVRSVRHSYLGDLFGSVSRTVGLGTVVTRMAR